MSLHPPAHIFIDANTALHFKRPDEIDWRALTGHDEIVIVVAPILLREIEQQKVHNPSRKLRDRAGGYIKWLAKFVRDPALELRPFTRWHFVDSEPLIEFADHNLVRTIADDHLIASVLAYEHGINASVFVATADIGLEVKLRSRKIEPLLLPDTYRLPDEPDPQEKELQNLRRQVASQRSPKLLLVTKTQNNCHEATPQPQVLVPSASSIEAVRSKNPALGQPKPANVNDQSLIGRLHIHVSSLERSLLSPERIAKYNKEREAFLNEYGKFLDELLAWEEQIALTTEIQLSLSNTGTAPATDIDVIFRFPSDLILIDKSELSSKPREPEPPVRPDHLAALMGVGRFGGLDIDRLYPAHSQFSMPHINSSTNVQAEQSQVTYWMRGLKHGFSEKLDTVYFQFPDRQAVRHFHAEYEISAAELADPIKGKLHFIADGEG